MADDKTEARELLDYVLKESFRKFFFEVVDGNNLKIMVEREAIEKYVVEKLSAIRIAAESAESAKYRACVEALHNNLRDIERLNELAHRNGLPAFDLMDEETRKALRDLDEARRG